LRFLSRLFRAVLGIVPFRRTLFHPRPYTFKQTDLSTRRKGNALGQIRLSLEDERRDRRFV
jgi:hypothetical protein